MKIRKTDALFQILKCNSIFFKVKEKIDKRVKKKNKNKKEINECFLLLLQVNSYFGLN